MLAFEVSDSLKKYYFWIIKAIIQLELKLRYLIHNQTYGQLAEIPSTREYKNKQLAINCNLVKKKSLINSIAEQLFSFS